MQISKIELKSQRHYTDFKKIKYLSVVNDTYVYWVHINGGKLHKCKPETFERWAKEIMPKSFTIIKRQLYYISLGLNSIKKSFSLIQQELKHYE